MKKKLCTFNWSAVLGLLAYIYKIIIIEILMRNLKNMSHKHTMYVKVHKYEKNKIGIQFFDMMNMLKISRFLPKRVGWHTLLGQPC